MAQLPKSVEQIFGDVLELSPEQRLIHLDQACRAAPELRLLVDELLAQHDAAGSFLAQPLAREKIRVVESQSTAALPVNAGLPSRFRPAQQIAGRFSVVRFIARGGMGEVYEVEDGLLHGARVALKIILPEIAAAHESSRRFEQEVLLARKVTHPNLCPIYELFHCEEPQPAFLFLTMKLLHGETLHAHLSRGIPFPREDADCICRELLEGVAAIHAAGVIHRDLKPNNVMLERSPGKLCVSIMDFGLARLHESESTLLQQGVVAGTPGYLAPELLQGQRPTQATDLFALGVVFHQVLTGKRPAEVRGAGVVTPSRSLDGCAAPDLVAAVKAFLSTDPETRNRGWRKLRERNQLSPSAASSSRPHHLTRRQFLYAASVSACAVAGVAEWKRDRLYKLLHPLPSRRFVAVLSWPPPADIQLRPMVLALVDAVAEGLARAEAFDHNFFVSAQKTLAEMTTSAQLNEARESLGANLVLATTAEAAGSTVRVMLHVLDPVTGRSLRSQELHTPLDMQFSLPQKTVLAAAELLDLNAAEIEGRHNRGLTDNPAALAAYQAAEAYRKEENDTGLEKAIEKYKEAIEIDPHYALAQARLGWAYLRSYGMHGDAAALSLGRENCETALATDPNVVEAHVGLAWVLGETGDTRGALREIAKGLTLDPSNTITLLYKAHFEAADGHNDVAEETFRRILKLRPNYWLPHSELGVLLDNEARYADALLEFRQASLLAPKNALALSNVGSVYLQLGRLNEAAQSSEASLTLRESDGAASTLATVFYLHQDYKRAIEYAEKAVNLGATESMNWLQLGDYSVAASKSAKDVSEAYRRGIAAETEELRTEPKKGSGWMLLALLRAKAGQHALATESLQRADSLNAQDITSQLFKVRTLELLGRRDEALSLIAACLRRGATVFQVDTMPDLAMLRTDSRYQGIGK